MRSVTFLVTAVEDQPVLSSVAGTSGIEMGVFDEDPVEPPVFGLADILASCSDVDLPYDDTLLNLGK